MFSIFFACLRFLLPFLYVMLGERIAFDLGGMTRGF